MVSSHSASDDDSQSSASDSSNDETASSTYTSRSSVRGSSLSSGSERALYVGHGTTRRKSAPDDLMSSKFLTEERVELVNFMLRQLKRSSSAESADDVTTANTAANGKSMKLSAEELALAERKRAALKRQRHKSDCATGIRFALQDSQEGEEEWNADDRKVSRGARLRNRKPTGHPALGQHVARMLMQMTSETSDSDNKYDETSAEEEGKFEPAALTAKPKKGALKKVSPTTSTPIQPSNTGTVHATPPLPPREKPNVKRKRANKKEASPIEPATSTMDCKPNEVSTNKRKKKVASSVSSSASSQSRNTKSLMPQAEAPKNKSPNCPLPASMSTRTKTSSPKSSSQVQSSSANSPTKKRAGNATSDIVFSPSHESPPNGSSHPNGVSHPTKQISSSSPRSSRLEMNLSHTHKTDVMVLRNETSNEIWTSITQDGTTTKLTRQDVHRLLDRIRNGSRADDADLICVLEESRRLIDQLDSA